MRDYFLYNASFDYMHRISASGVHASWEPLLYTVLNLAVLRTYGLCV